jgi:hypothetical protein
MIFPGCTFRTAIRSRLTIACGATLMVLAGCGSSPWASEFRSSGIAAGALTAQVPVRIREVPWDRIQQALAELEQERSESDIHPDDWDADRKLAAKTSLLRALQVSEDPRLVDVLGRSVFTTTDNIRPDDGELAKFARTKGATTVIWSSSYLGRTEVVRSEPVTEWRSGTWQRWHGRGGGTYWSESSTIWVPVVVTADQRAWMAFFLREPAPVVSLRVSNR